MIKSKKFEKFKFHPPSTYKYRLRFKNSKYIYIMVKCGMVVLTGRKKTDVSDVDVAMSWML
jgi:hypothetical protein